MSDRIGFEGEEERGTVRVRKKLQINGAELHQPRIKICSLCLPGKIMSREGCHDERDFMDRSQIQAAPQQRGIVQTQRDL